MIATEKELAKLLKEVEAWQSGHFLFTSGFHGSDYIQCQKVLQYPRYGQILAEALVKQVRNAGLEPTAIVGPALGAVHWGVYMAAAMDYYYEEPIKAIFAERKVGSDDFEIRRGIEITPGEQVLVVEDVTTTGGSVQKVLDLVRKLGGKPVAVGAIVDRSGQKISFDVPFLSLIKLNLVKFSAVECPMCTENVPLVKPGSSSKEN